MIKEKFLQLKSKTKSKVRIFYLKWKLEKTTDYRELTQKQFNQFAAWMRETFVDFKLSKAIFNRCDKHHPCLLYIHVNNEAYKGDYIISIKARKTKPKFNVTFEKAWKHDPTNTYYTKIYNKDVNNFNDITLKKNE